jgi:K+-sensing histidine kinase KdpD
VSMRADWQVASTTTQTVLKRWITPITASVLLVIATTTLLWLYDTPLQHDHLIFIYFLPTALIAIRYGSLSAMFVTIGSSFAAAYLFYRPRFSLMVDNPLDVLELVFFCMLALLASKVVSGFDRDGEIAKRRRWATRLPWTRWWSRLPQQAVDRPPAKRSGQNV